MGTETKRDDVEQYNKSQLILQIPRKHHYNIEYRKQGSSSATMEIAFSFSWFALVAATTFIVVAKKEIENGNRARRKVHYLVVRNLV